MPSDVSSHLLLNPDSPDGTWDQLFMIAGGTGITPILQLIKFHLDAIATSRDRKIWMHVLYANRAVEDIIDGITLEGYAATSKGMLTITYILDNPPREKWDGLCGRITTTVLHSWISHHLCREEGAVMQPPRFPTPTDPPMPIVENDHYGDGLANHVQHEYEENHGLVRSQVDHEMVNVVDHSVVVGSMTSEPTSNEVTPGSADNILQGRQQGHLSSTLSTSTNGQLPYTPNVQHQYSDSSYMRVPTPASLPAIYPHQNSRFKIISCGPPEMLDGVYSSLKEMGYPDSDIIILS
jgi:NAD(P)H-flavin reductase